MDNDSSGDQSRPGIGSVEVTALWRNRLHGRLAERATPVVVTPTAVRSAASLWAGAREWTRFLRAQGAGDRTRVACMHDDTAVVLQLLVACLWDGLDLWLCHANDVGAAEAWGSVLVGATSPDGARGPWHIPLPGGWPDAQVPPRRHQPALRPAGVVTPAEVRCLDGAAVSHAQLLQDADALAAEWALTTARVLAVGSHGTRAGLTAGLLAPVLYAEELFVAPDDVAARALLHREPVTHLVATGEAAGGDVVSWWQGGGAAEMPEVRLCTCTVWPTR